MPSPDNSTHPTPELIESFLQNVRGSTPLAIEQINIMLGLVAAGCHRVDRYLDLGCGGGVAAAALFAEYPHTEGVMVCGTQAQLQAARLQLGPHASQAALRLAKIERPEWQDEVSSRGPFDLITASIEIALLPGERRRKIFAEVFDLLAPGGLLLNVACVASAIRWTESQWEDQVIDAIFGEVIRAGEKKPRLEVAREWYGQLAARGGSIAPLEIQCDWLREIGFENVECYHKVSELAVFGGQKPGSPLWQHDSSGS